MDLLKFIKENNDLLDEAKSCKSKEELQDLMKRKGIVIKGLKIDEIYDYVNNLHNQLKDDALEGVAGGSGREKMVRKINDKLDPPCLEGTPVPLTNEDLSDLLAQDPNAKIFLEESTNTWYKLTK